MIIVGVCVMIFCGSGTILTDSNPYQICDSTLHGDRDYITFITPSHTIESIYLGITEDEYRDSMYRLGMRQGYTFNEVPEMLIGSDRCVRVIGDYIMNRYETDYMRATASLYLVQTGIEYESDDVNYGVAEYWARPTETLYHLKGDCEDTAILFCSICRYMGIKAILLNGDGHIGSAVCVNAIGEPYIYNGEEYYSCSTTSSYTERIGSSVMVQDAMWIKEEGPRFLYYLYSFGKQIGDKVEGRLCSL